MGKMIDLLNQTFGKLKVISHEGSHPKNQGNLWLCKCSCGTFKTYLTSTLRAGRAISCGCVRNERIGNFKRLPGDLTGKNRLIAIYRKSAKKRNLSFEITEKHFFILTKQKCHYCGVEPFNSTKTIAPRGKVPYIYNGIDRIRHDTGYTIENCVPCCRPCNLAKNIHSYDVFIQYLDRITKFRLSK